MQQPQSSPSNLTAEPPSNLTAEPPLFSQPPSNITAEAPLSSLPPSNITAEAPLSLLPPSNLTAEPPLSPPAASDSAAEEDSEAAADLRPDETVIDCETDSDAEEVCRICHVSPDRDEEGGGSGSDLIDIGCGCKDGLGTAHRHCAEAWFKLKGNRCCEICGSNAKNITGFENQGFMEIWHERRVVPVSSSTSRTGRTGQAETGNGCWKRQPFCNFLMACLVIAFILPWFFRVNMF